MKKIQILDYWLKTNSQKCIIEHKRLQKNAVIKSQGENTVYFFFCIIQETKESETPKTLGIERDFQFMNIYVITAGYKNCLLLKIRNLTCKFPGGNISLCIGNILNHIC